MTVPGEVAMLSTDATTPGGLYVAVPAGDNNVNGSVVVCPPGALTIADMLAALGLDPATIVMNCNIPARATGAFVGVGDSGLPIFDV